MTKITKNQRGTGLIETALASVVFFMLVAGILDFGRMHYTRSKLQHAVSQATRFATIGAALADPNGSTLSREESIYKFVKEFSGLADLTPGNILISSRNGSGIVSADAGGPGDVVSVRASYGVKLVAPYLHLLYDEGKFTFTCSTTFRNEEFSGA